MLIVLPALCLISVAFAILYIIRLLEVLSVIDEATDCSCQPTLKSPRKRAPQNLLSSSLASDVFIFTPLFGYSLLLSSYVLFYNVTLVIKKNLLEF